jgi:hypothetical protein
MLPLVCNDAVALLFMFDLSRRNTLNSIKEWYRQARGFNKVILILISINLVKKIYKDRNSILGWNEIRPFCYSAARGTRRNYKSGKFSLPFESI